MKKSLAIILALVLAISLLVPAAAFAADYKIVYSLGGKTAAGIFDYVNSNYSSYLAGSTNLVSQFATYANDATEATSAVRERFTGVPLKSEFDRLVGLVAGSGWATAINDSHLSFAPSGAQEFLLDTSKTLADLAAFGTITITYHPEDSSLGDYTLSVSASLKDEGGGYSGGGSETTTPTETKGETTTADDGTKATETKDAEGNVTEVKAEVADDVTETTLPVEVKPAESVEDAATVEIDIPDGKTVDVEIPVDSDSSRLVVYKVNPDGTKEIMPIVAKTEDGVKLKLDDNVKIQIVEKTDDNGVDQDAWYADAMNNVYDNEIDDSIPTTELVPEDDCNRGTFTTLLYNMCGQQTATGAGFPDTNSSDYYEDASTWGQAIGLIKGEVQEDGTVVFNGEGNLERQQMATFLWRMAGAPQVDAMSGVTTDETCADYVNAMSWAISVGLIKGDEGGYRPGDPASVAEAAQMILNFVNLGFAGVSN